VTYILSLIDAFKSTLLKSATSVSGISGANVTLGQNGTLSLKTTDASGLVMFDNLKPGLATLHITLTGYSEINAVIDFHDTGEDTIVNGGRQVGNVIPMIAISGSSTGIIKGKTTCESDLTNKTPEVVPGGTKIIATVNPSSAALAGIAGGVIKTISYDNLSLEGTTDVNGDFTLTVPATSKGLDYTLKVSDFTINQSLLMNTKNGIAVTGVQTVLTKFGSSFSTGSSTIPNVNPIIATIGPPDYIYTQATATAVISEGGVSAINLTNGGSNYISGKVIVIIGNPGLSGTTATANAVVSADGKIASINLTSNGSNYTSAPTVTILNMVEKVQARATANLNSDGSIVSISMINNGNGYLSVPSVSITPAVLTFGSGASAVAVMEEGTISSIVLVTGGNGYFGVNTPAVVNNAPSSIDVNAKGTGTSIKDIYLGTGKRTIEN
jgi:hypothetical protein